MDSKFNGKYDSVCTLDFYVRMMDDTGIYLLGFRASGSFADIGGPDKSSNGGSLWRQTDSLRTGKIVITRFDKTKRKIDGVFQFDVLDTLTNTIKHITDGVINDFSYNE